MHGYIFSVHNWGVCWVTFGETCFAWYCVIHLSFILVDVNLFPKLMVRSSVPTVERIETGYTVVDRRYWFRKRGNCRHYDCRRALLLSEEMDWICPVSCCQTYPTHLKLTVHRSDSLITTLIVYTLATGLITRYKRHVLRIPVHTNALSSASWCCYVWLRFVAAILPSHFQMLDPLKIHPSAVRSDAIKFHYCWDLLDYREM